LLDNLRGIHVLPRLPRLLRHSAKSLASSSASCQCRCHIIRHRLEGYCNVARLHCEPYSRPRKGEVSLKAIRVDLRRHFCLATFQSKLRHTPLC
jgi:hypothetical protein